jgi:ATP phosphoribosyltransferase-like protein
MPNICLQHLVALYLVDRKLTFDSVHDYSRMDDPRVRDIRNKIQLISSDALMKSGGRQAIVKITTLDGQALNKHVQHVRGTWGDPMPRAEVDAKARDLLAPILGNEPTSLLLSSLWQLEYLSADELNALIEKACVITPGIESPTVSSLHDSAWSAVRAMVPRKQVHGVMDELYDLGARGVIVTDIHACRI